MLSRIKPRLDQTLPIGNEGAGVVIAEGDILAAMEAVGSKDATGFNTYGSVDNKQAHFIRRSVMAG